MCSQELGHMHHHPSATSRDKAQGFGVTFPNPPPDRTWQSFCESCRVPTAEQSFSPPQVADSKCIAEQQHSPMSWQHLPQDAEARWFENRRGMVPASGWL